MVDVEGVAQQRYLLVRAFGRAISDYDLLTGNHSGRVSHLAALLAAQLDLDRPDRLLVAHAGVVHDLGKLGIDPRILSKPGPLTTDERAEIERHPIIGSEMLLSISPDLAPMAAGVRAHHERWDGRGYPDGLAGSEIPVFGRVLGVVDVYDALTHPRSYRRTVFSAAKARSYLEEHAGTQFEPECVHATMDILRAAERARRQFAVSEPQNGRPRVP